MHSTHFFIAVALLDTGPGILPGRRLVPLDIPRDSLAWKDDPAVRVRVSISLLSDVPLQLVPWDTQTRRMVGRREMPWRNRFAGDGEYRFANPLAALLSPFTWPRQLSGLRGWAVTVFMKPSTRSILWWGPRCGGAMKITVRRSATPSPAGLLHPRLARPGRE